jgi:glutamate N-acetyltransferase/amino-acid N-acetyltransferase
MEALQAQVGGVTITLGGMAKGSGMIHPNMATMLAFITTDAAITSAMLKKALHRAVEGSFNMITVDGDTSTNDMVVVLANGTAGNPLIDKEDMAYHGFQRALKQLCVLLAKLIVRDGEGATKFVEVEVRNASTGEDAQRIAKSVAASNLVKTALFGEDANWGRILAAAGYSGASFDPGKVDIFFKSAGGIEQVAGDGAGLIFSEQNVGGILKEGDITILIDLNQGTAGARAWTCDLSGEYIKINASYRS